jgi:hypothetical protein
MMQPSKRSERGEDSQKRVNSPRSGKMRFPIGVENALYSADLMAGRGLFRARAVARFRDFGRATACLRRKPSDAFSS